MTRIHCQFCGMLHVPPTYFRPPSQTCDRCWLWIQGQINADAAWRAAVAEREKERA
jgi:hypothetical protein